MKLFDFAYLFKNIPEVLRHFPVTLEAAAGSFLCGIVVALVAALIKIYKVPYLKRLVDLYVSFMRGTPLLVNLYLVSFGFPRTVHFFKIKYGWFEGFNPSLVNPVYFALFAFTMYIGAYLTEEMRASIEAVGAGQFEAARSVGMTFRQSIRRIILPQAVKIALPMMGNALISVTKGTSFLYLVNVRDITSTARILSTRGGSPFELYVFVGFLYWVLCFTIERLVGYMEKRLKVSEKNMAEAAV
jgi:His/Glu/Gln/Arg/opine family amino acid ABC transporter permease subunit